MANMERASYQLIIAKYAKRGKGNVRLTQSSLNLWQAITPNTKTYNFPILQSDNQSPIQPEEIRLNLNDEFISYEVQLLINFKQRDFDLPPGSNETNIYLTYAPMELNGAFRLLNALYDGNMKIAVNNITRYENWDLLKHMAIPRTQFKSSSAGLPAPTIPNIVFNQDGAVKMQPMITFTGAKKNEVTINLVQSLPAGLSGTWSQNVAVPGGAQYAIDSKNLVLVFRGMLGQNAAVFQK